MYVKLFWAKATDQFANLSGIYYRYVRDTFDYFHVNPYYNPYYVAPTGTNLPRFTACLFAEIMNYSGIFIHLSMLRAFQIVCFHCKKKINVFYGKIPGIWLPVLLPLFLRAFTCRTFLEIKIW